MINRGKLVTFFVVFMILSSGIIDVYAKSLSLDEAVQIALKNNPQLLMLRRSVSSSESAIRAKELSRYGEIYIQGGFKKTGEDFIVFPMYKEAFGSSSGLPLIS
ncbi:MAG: TolC family protein, partial [Nitrospirae bacterium]|nr:TolC family protein [Nitrospirota bacterium]